MIRLLITDDHAIVRSGLKQLFAEISDFQVVGEAANGAELLTQLRGLAVDVVLLDLDMPGVSGADLIARLRAHYPSLPILVLSMHNEAHLAMRALKAGATGYITKDSDLEVLLPAIRQVCNGKTFITPGMAEQIVLQEISGVQQAPHKLLTERELQVLELLVSGRTVLEIAADLAISNKTVSTHKARAMEKMAITNTADLMRYALQHGMGGTALASASQSAHE